MTNGYSRRARVEERKNIRKAYLYIILSVVSLVLLFFWGLPILIKFAGFFTNLGKSDKPVDVADITPPAPPWLGNVAEYTNKESLKIEGQSEEGANIILTFNGQTLETVANNEGVFSFNLSLLNGENKISAKAKDVSGNEGQETDTIEIMFDNLPPSLEIISPSDGESFYGPTQRQILIKGNTDSDSEVSINDRFTAVLEDGSFNFSQTLSEGTNSFNIISKDKAGNETSLSFSVNFVL